MPKLDNCIVQDIHIRLLLIMTEEVKHSFNRLNDYLLVMGMQQSGLENSCDISTLSTYLSSSQQVFDKILGWTEFQLLGEAIYTFRIRLQVDLAIYSMRHLFTDHQIQFKNNVKDIKGKNFSISLLKFVLRNILINYINLSKRAGVIEIDSEENEEYVVICITDLRRRENSSMSEDLCQEKNEAPFSSCFVLCTPLLRLHGGKLWIGNTDSARPKLYFSIPIVKCD